MFWIISFVVVVGVIAVVINRRGSSGASRRDDLASGHQRDGTKGTGYVSGDGGGGMAGF